MDVFIRLINFPGVEIFVCKEIYGWIYSYNFYFQDKIKCNWILTINHILAYFYIVNVTWWLKFVYNISMWSTSQLIF